MSPIKNISALGILLILMGVVASEDSPHVLPTSGSYKILMLLPFGSPSHRNCFLPLAEGLADRGHQVVILSALPPRANHPNITEINHGINLEGLIGNLNKFQIREKDSTGGFSNFKVVLPKLMRAMYQTTLVKDLYNRRHDFDLMVIDELFNEPAYPFLEGKKYIAIGTAGFTPMTSGVLGNILHPAYISFTKDYPRPFSFFSRLSNTFWHFFIPFYWRHLQVVPELQKVATELFPELPPLLEIERRGLVLVLSNSHFTYDTSIPKLPSQIEIGGMHCRPGKQLPQDLQEWISGAGPQGVVYFSLGTIAKGVTLPSKYKDILVQTFSKLEQRIIWKFEDDFPGLPENVMAKKWLPQQDILAHPNIKLFITHGGVLSMQEAIYHAKPLLALPIFADQPKNAGLIQNKGFGLFLIWEELTVEKVVDAIREIINNPKYLTTISRASELFLDQPTKPLDSAVWWTEYVIRNRGAPQLRSPAADLSWTEYFMLDVILLFYLIVFTMYWLLMKIYTLLCKSKRTSHSGHTNSKNKIKKKRKTE